jgi:putative transposase
MLIREAADPALSTRQRGKLVRAIAAREHADPSGRPVRLTQVDPGPVGPDVAAGRV